jgi:hypothetical protein
VTKKVVGVFCVFRAATSGRSCLILRMRLLYLLTLNDDVHVAFAPNLNKKEREKCGCKASLI